MNLFNSLKIKILSSKLILCLASIATSFFFMSNLFLKEKKTDIFEIGLIRSKLILGEFENDYKIATLLYESGNLEGAGEVEEVFTCQGTIVEGPSIRANFNPCPGKNQIKRQGDHFLVSFYRGKKGITYAFRISTENMAGLKHGIGYLSIIDEKSGEEIFSNSDEKLFTKIAKLGTDAVNFAKEMQIDGVDYLTVSVKSQSLPWRSFIFYNGDVVYQSLKIVQFEIMSLVLIIIGAIVILSVLLSNHLSGPINKLKEVAEQIKEGHFSQRFLGKVYGEFKLLGETFNEMADKIVYFLDEMKEKTRLESEVKVAQLVQSSFFPRSAHLDEKLQIHGYYKSASECGGDWWTFKEHEGKVYFALGDATGHGVASSLIAASVHSFSSLWNRMFSENKGIDLSPSEMLNYFNDIILGAGGNLNMTMFIGILDKKTNELVYANASHEQPFMIASSTKDEIQFLDGNSGPRLGQESNPKYAQFSVFIPQESFIVIYSDGYTEGLNEEGKMWGEGRFLRELAKNYTLKKADRMNEAINSGFKKFVGQAEQGDDLSLLTIFIN